MKPTLMALAILCCCILLWKCSKRMEGDRRTSAFEEKILGKWKLANSPFSGYWEFKSNVVDSLCTSNKTVRQLDIHIPGFCAGKGYWSLSSDSILNNSCIPMARVIKLTNDSLIFKFSSGWYEFEYKWTR